MKFNTITLSRVIVALVFLFGAVVFEQAAVFAATEKIDGTSGTPLGGIGAGAVKFWPKPGAFCEVEITPVSNTQDSFSIIPGTRLQLYTNRAGTIQTADTLKAVVVNGKYDDDAVYPIHLVNLGSYNGVSVKLTAFSPFDFSTANAMTYPYAFFDIALTNTLGTDCDAACAFQVTTPTAPVVVAGKGIRNSNPGKWERAVYAKSSDANAVVTVGNDNGFFSSGQCSNTVSGTLNRTAVKIKLGANETKHIKFVYAWYCGDNPAHYFYTNTAMNAGAVADSGLVSFDRIEQKAVSVVSRMRGSNFPEWFKNNLLTVLSNFTTNSVYMKDGRYGHSEGMWNLIGTMDQMWHARQINTMVFPEVAWQELRFWARTQKPNGQIHHDFGFGEPVAWDDQTHDCYNGQECDSWVDLNCGFIISVYEYFVATGNRERLTYLWSYAKKATQRILDQYTEHPTAGYTFSFSGTGSSYDSGGDSNPYNNGLAIAALKIMLKLAGIQNDTASKAAWTAAYTGAAASFKKRYLTNNYPSSIVACENGVAGQWIAYYLKLGELFAATDLDYALGVLNSYYKPLAGLGNPTGPDRREWGVYVLSHYAGILLQTGRVREWKALQYDWWDRNFTNRNLVYHQYIDIPPKATVYPANAANCWDQGHRLCQYISIPELWRNYYTAIGYFRNKHTGELWIEPIVPDSTMNHTITNAMYFSPEGMGTINYKESGPSYAVQDITIKSDNPIPVTGLYLRDKFGAADSGVTVNGVKQTYTRIGTGYCRELKVNWNGTVDSNGITIRAGNIGSAGVVIPAGDAASRRWCRIFTATGLRVILPPEMNEGNPTFIVYDMAGKVVGTASAKNGVVDLRKDCGISSGVHILGKP